MTMQTEDLGNGFSLVFQSGAGGFRAVVKTADGSIVARGPVVPEREVGRSRFMAVSEWMQTHLPEPESAPGVDELYPEDDPDEGDEEEEDTDDEEDEELL